VTIEHATDEPVTYPIDAALHEAHRKALASRVPAAIAAAQLDLAIREHRLFGALVAMLRTSHIRIEEPRRMSVTAKVALMASPGFAPKKSPLARSRALAMLIVHDLDVPADQLDSTVRQVLLLARECLPSQGRRARVAT
jgi:hypothetical protein